LWICSKNCTLFITNDKSNHIFIQNLWPYIVFTGLLCKIA
jgi:hypothetical protein